jgi:hypothetical protein
VTAAKRSHVLARDGVAIPDARPLTRSVPPRQHRLALDLEERQLVTEVVGVWDMFTHCHGSLRTLAGSI